MIQNLPPEAKILILNAACLAVAYLGIYPSIRHKTVHRIALADLGVTAAALAAAGALFAGSGIRFHLLGVPMGWLGFAFVTFLLMEIPLMAWFFRRHGIDPGGGE